MTAASTAVWTCTTALSLLTTKCVLDTEFHYPMHLMSIHVTGTIVVKLVQSMYRRRVPLRTHSTSSTDLSLPSLEWPTTPLETCIKAASAACIGAALACGYQAIHHFHNVPTVVMVMAVSVEAPLQTTLCVGADEEVDAVRLRSRSHRLATKLLLVVGLALELVCDFRVSIVGSLMLLLAAILAKLGSAVSMHIREDDHAGGMDTYSVVGAIATSAFWCRFREQQYSAIQAHKHLTADFPLLCVNLVSAVASLSMGQTLFRSCSSRCEAGTTQQPYTHRRVAVMVSLLALVYAGGCVLQPLPPRISFWQWTGFVAALMAAVFDHSAHHAAATPTWIVPKSFDMTESPCTTKQERIHIGELAQAGMMAVPRSMHVLSMLLGSILLLGLFTSPAWTGPRARDSIAPEKNPASPSQSLDIVIARYEESPAQVVKQIVELESILAIQQRDPTFTIYNKGGVAHNDTALPVELELWFDRLALPMPTIIVHQLKNVGRETDSYLEHITRRWESLATHTIFMQANVHQSRAYRQRIQHYFVPSTGFLSLADGRGHCSACERCFDRDWAEDPLLLTRIFGDFNVGPCRDVVLTYRGQFIVSAQRIHGSPREAYQHWLDQLRDPQSELHSPPYVNSTWSRKVDSMSAPRVGFTLERTWGVMFRCNDKRISERCPSMLSRTLCPSRWCGSQSIADCQCLDM